MTVNKQGMPVCITHRDIPMLRQPGYYFLTESEKNKAGGLKIIAGNGIPLITYTCKICGYIENYAAMANEEWGIKRLYVKCKNEKCRREFISPIQMNEGSLKKSTLENDSYQCDYCNQNSKYNKEDHFFK